MDEQRFVISDGLWRWLECEGHLNRECYWC